MSLVHSRVPNISVGQNKSIGRGNFLKFNNSIGNLLTAITVIYFAKFDLVGILKVMMVRNEFQPSH